MSVFATKMAALGPVGWWRLGEPAGALAIDSSSKHINGKYLNAPSLGEAGAIVGDGDTACRFRSANFQKVYIPDHNIYSLTRANDNFNRTEDWGSSWGAADHGAIGLLRFLPAFIIQFLVAPLT
jgi:hypothetical protein